MLLLQTMVWPSPPWVGMAAALLLTVMFLLLPFMIAACTWGLRLRRDDIAAVIFCSLPHGYQKTGTYGCNKAQSQVSTTLLSTSYSTQLQHTAVGHDINNTPDMSLVQNVTTCGNWGNSALASESVSRGTISEVSKTSSAKANHQVVIHTPMLQ